MRDLPATMLAESRADTSSSSYHNRHRSVLGVRPARPTLPRWTLTDSSPSSSFSRSIFCIDTWSSTSSGWQGTLPSNDIWCSLPIGSATFPPAVTREPTQFADSRDLFFHQPKEHASPFAIAMKGTLLLRRVVDFVRRADMGNVELPRADSAFKDLDETIAQFQ